MIPTAEKEIDGVMFEVRGLDLRTERAMLLRLGKILGPAIGELARGGSAAAGGAFAKLMEEISDAEMDYLCSTFAKVTQVTVQMANGPQKVPVTDANFTNGVASQLAWLWFCLENQYASFLGGDSSKTTDLFSRLLAKVSR